MEKILDTLNRARSEFVFSGFQLYSEHRGETLSLAGGDTAYWPGHAPVTPATYFDIGSLTKVVATTSLLARLADRKKIDLSRPIGDVVPRLKGGPLAGVTLEELLNHCSGLVWWHPLHETLGKSTLLEWVVNHGGTLLAGRPREKAVYSDPDFWLLGLAVEQSHSALADAFGAEVIRPLKMQETVYGPLRSHDRVAATEVSPGRGRLLWGEVFDDNAHALGGTAPHAGLFSTARGLGPFCREWIAAWHGRSPWLAQPIARRFTTRAGWVAGSSWALGWDTPTAGSSTSGRHFSPNSFGHLGFTGCSVWIDPEKEVFVVFLSNRVHPSRVDERIRALRPNLHDAVMRHWGLSDG